MAKIAKSSIKTLIVFQLLLLSLSVYAWVEQPVDLAQDIEGVYPDGDCSVRLSDSASELECNKVILQVPPEQVDRCDFVKDSYAVQPPNFCHRWNLVWQYGGSVDTKSWPDIAVTDYRLATFKELTKLALNDDVSSSIIGSWFDSNTNFENVWLISSSYAKGTGTCGNHIYGVNASTGLTGRFKLIDVEVDDGAGGTTTESQWRMLEGTTLDSCNYLEGEPNVQALVVNKSTVKELMEDPQP